MTDKPDPDDAMRRVERLTEPEATLHGVQFMGEDGVYWYYLAVMEKEYEGSQFLNERYVQLAKPDPPEGYEEREDSFKTNGINRRYDEKGLVRGAEDLSKLYSLVSRKAEGLLSREKPVYNE